MIALPLLMAAVQATTSIDDPRSPEVEARLVACGIPASAVTVRYVDDFQSDVAEVAALGDVRTAALFECLRANHLLSVIFVFADDADRLWFEEQERRLIGDDGYFMSEAAARQYLAERGLSDVPVRNRDSESLPDYVRRLLGFCAAPADLLIFDDDAKPSWNMARLRAMVGSGRDDVESLACFFYVARLDDDVNAMIHGEGGIGLVGNEALAGDAP